TPGQVGFPSSLAAVPLPVFPAGAVQPLRSIYLRPGRAAFYSQFLNTALLKGYPDALLNPYSQQVTFGIERELGRNWVLSADYVGAHTIKVVRPLDVDSPDSFPRTVVGGVQQSRPAALANCSRPLWVAFYAAAGRACNSPGPTPAYSVVTTDM